MMKNKRLNTIIYIITTIIFSLYISNLYKEGDCTKDPILNYDYSVHYINAKTTSNYFKDNYSNWGYTSKWGAGYIQPLSGSNRPAAFISRLLPDSIYPLAFNIMIAIIIFIIPFILSISAKLLFTDQASQVNVFYFSTFSIIGSPLMQQFVFVGHYSFLLASSLTLLFVSLVHQFYLHKKNIYLALQAITAGLTIYLHPLALPILLFFFTIYSISFRHQLNTYNVTKILLCYIFLGILPNMFWIPSFIYAIALCHEPNSSSQYLQSGLVDTTKMILKDPIMCIAILATIALIYTKKIKRTIPNILLLSLSVIFLLIAYLGTQSGFGDSQPLRFMIPMLLYLVVLMGHIQNKKINLSLFIIMLSTSCYSYLISEYRSGLYCGINNHQIKDLFKFINKNLSKETRLLIQMNHDPIHKMRISSIIPFYLKNPVVAYPLPYPRHYAQFLDNKIFNTDLENININKLRDKIELYNIGNILTVTPIAKEKFTQVSFLKKIYDQDQFAIFKNTHSKSTFCHNCYAKICEHDNKIIIKNVKNEKNLILKYHYHFSLESLTDNVSLEPVYLADDPIPFIKLNTNGKNNIEIDYSKKNKQIYDFTSNPVIKTKLQDYSFH